MSRSNPVDMFGEFDTGSNNSNSSSSDDESNTYNRQITWGSAAWQEVPNGIPTECYCGQPAIIKTYMHNAQNGRRYYSCAGPMDDGDCHIWKMWDDAIMEEIASLKNKLEYAEKETNDLKDMVKELQSKVFRKGKEVQTPEKMIKDLHVV